MGGIMTDFQEWLRPLGAAAAVMLALGSLGVTGAVAQTATNLICDGCVNSKDIKNGSVTGRDIKNRSITGADITDGSITGADIQNGSVAPADLAAPPMVGTNAVSTTVNPLTAIQYGQSVASVTLNIPAPGSILLNASALINFWHAPRDAVCYLAKEPGPYLSGKYAGVSEPTVGPIHTVSVTNVLDELLVGQQTYNLFCVASGTGVSVHAPSITALYVPAVPN
jgi:hypothetical protein